MNDYINIAPPKVITVRFLKTQGAEDLFVAVPGNLRKVYVRQPIDDKHAMWLTTSKWSGGYEASCPISAGVVFYIVDPNGNYASMEAVQRFDGFFYPVAYKQFPFFGKWLVNASQQTANNHGLKTHEEWKSYLMSGGLYDGRDYLDNWLYCNSVETAVVMTGALSYLGNPVSIIRRSYRHDPTGRKYHRYSLETADCISCLALCGYEWEESEP